jgi:protein-S-isoprenylcysteine O-methyltransferase Ste14
VYLFWAFGKGTLAPWTPTQKLIIRGPYKYCRNPMISGVLFVLLGEAIVLNSVNILIIAGLFFIINTIYFILFEEPDLNERFGKEYEEYKKNVPRWIPKFKPYVKDK